MVLMQVGNCLFNQPAGVRGQAIRAEDGAVRFPLLRTLLLFRS